MDRTDYDVQAATMGTSMVLVLLLLLVLPAQVQSRPAPTPSVHLGKRVCPRACIHPGVHLHVVRKVTGAIICKAFCMAINHCLLLVSAHACLT